MKIGAIQCKAVPGAIDANIAWHIKFLELAAGYGSDIAFFPELSITGYEPQLAKSLAMETSDPILDIFQEQSDKFGMIVGIGLPIAAGEQVQIGMAWFSPNNQPLSYAKQQLHVDELPFFVPGENQLILRSGKYQFAPAICYESLQPSHANHAADSGANVYLASVAKPDRGVVKAAMHYQKMARKNSMYVVMANCLGPSGDFLGAGQSAAWSKNGELLAQMDTDSEGILVLDLESGETAIHTVTKYIECC